MMRSPANEAIADSSGYIKCSAHANQDVAYSTHSRIPIIFRDTVATIDHPTIGGWFENKVGEQVLEKYCQNKVLCSLFEVRNSIKHIRFHGENEKDVMIVTVTRQGKAYIDSFLRPEFEFMFQMPDKWVNELFSGP